MKYFTKKRILAAVLAVLLLVSLAISAVADSAVCDLNGDGKISVFDAQLLLEAQAGLRQLSGAENITVLDVIKLVLGGMPGAIDTDQDGVIEIYSASGLKQITYNPGGSYILMNDIDMEGANWLPIAKFTGTFNGNNKTISNVNIKNSVSGLNTTNPTPINQGFFGDTSAAAVIKDLNLRNVTVTAAENSQYIGLLIGSNRGKIENCTVTGTIIDTRETYAKNVYIGVVAGRICDPMASKPGSFIGGTNISVTDDAGVTTTTGLCANVVLKVANRDQLNKMDGAYHKIGLTGWAHESTTVSGQWAESSNDTALLSAAVQERRATAISYMNAMGSAQWTPSENLVYDSGDGTVKTYKQGVTYIGLPYNRNNGSLERFQSALNADGTTKAGLGSSYWDDELGYSGFTLLMGNNCSTAVGWAWMRVSPVQVDQIDTHKTPYHGGSYVTATIRMLPTAYTRETYGIYAVGDWENFYYVNEDGKRVEKEYDDSLAAYSCTNEQYTLDVLTANGADTMLEAYAKSRGGDAIVAYAANWSDTLTDAGHARLVAADAITIRNEDGTIDPDKSYLVTTEQGASSGSNSNWRVNYSYSFRTLLDDPADNTSTGFGRTYLPITIRALHDNTIRVSYVTMYTGDDAVVAPDQGRVYSNFRVLSTTVTIKDGDAVVYEGEVFTGIGGKSEQYAGKFQSVYLDGHSEGVAAAGLTEGKEYTFSLTVTTSDGTDHVQITDQAFTYSAE